MRTSSLLFLLAAGLVSCALWLRCSPRRIAPAPAVPSTPARRDDHRVLNAWQGGIKLEAESSYPAATREALEKLRREELRQRPQEGRN